MFHDDKEVAAVRLRKPFLHRELPFRLDRKRISRELECAAIEHGRPEFWSVDDGWVVSFTMGEWGGCTCWFNKEGKSYELLTKKATSCFGKMGPRFFVFVRSGFWDKGTGICYEFEKSEDAHSLQLIQYCNGFPYCASVDLKDRLLFVTSTTLYQMQPDNALIRLQGLEFALYYYANSVIAVKNKIFIGMQFGVMRLDDKGIHWLVPNKYFQQVFVKGLIWPSDESDAWRTRYLLEDRIDSYISAGSLDRGGVITRKEIPLLLSLSGVWVVIVFSILFGWLMIFRHKLLGGLIRAVLFILFSQIATLSVTLMWSGHVWDSNFILGGFLHIPALIVCTLISAPFIIREIWKHPGKVATQDNISDKNAV